MDKIRDLLKQMGATEEFTTKIMESLASYKQSIEKGLAVEFKNRLNEAKKVCVEEVEREKADIRQKVEVFLESRVNTIDREAQRQVAIGESEATRKLRGVKSLVDGIQIGGQSGDQAALAAENKKLRVKVGQLSEENSRLGAKATRANGIAMKVLQRNRTLEGQDKSGQVNESVESTKSKDTETESLESLRQASDTPKSTRPISESQVKPGSQKKTESGDPEIVSIASQLDGHPAFFGVTEA